MKINQQRYWDLLMQLAEITDPNKPYTRRSFSELFLEGRKWLIAQMQAAGLETHIDTAGNLIGTLKGINSNGKYIAIGSHSDTVPSGGRFDGIAGVIAGLECVLSWRDRGITFNHDIQIIDFLAEEPSEWGISCVGSRGMSGFLDDKLKNTTHPSSGETLAEAIKRVGGSPNNLNKRDDIDAFFELHIEQGRVLEEEKIDVGVVTGIVGIIRLEVVLTGQSNHAGTTPMSIRQDALTTAASIITHSANLATQMDAESEHYLVATCGQVFVTPNASNVVPGEVKLIFDIRSDNKALMEDFVTQLQDFTQKQTTADHIKLSNWQRLTDTRSMLSDETLMQHLDNACEKQNISYKRMPSGAGHDAAFMAHLSPIAMVFVPSLAGKSHCPEEWTDKDALGKGVSVLADAIEQYDQQFN
ncbi:Zn-dependent hydrolase [Pasteurella skyensis]|uniref:Zn-dependent hydrolase n=1 Tax=Phocoenobacter skyensis TaxID=97481 RepID=A0AAJ6N941_9PAST|nr:Zn-dependent hydrolase [Pasteurella skyensis]MDP8162501.1 Zn-dependent hydrolase [Pasteurella skyensis]MDP8172466.1 Zn-dependent hydrolase [Pasteurella skyensis]MDP8177491.1 Zn-dependent hydrolase [Pasteurella skyensis]MDP8178721.1 Zn-dependent hydrolase [Pasteurella skyensis]MDP8182989.1 Zn-dependent hydrolase [Pasteurella skyensis]